MTDAVELGFWDFSLAVYGGPGVADACIALQDEFGVDVNILLYLSFRAANGVRLSAADVAWLDQNVVDWRSQIVGPLRHVRRHLKQMVAMDAFDGAGDLREQIKTVELESERLQQQALDRLGSTLSGQADNVANALETNYRHYGEYLGCELPPDALQTLSRQVMNLAPAAARRR